MRVPVENARAQVLHPGEVACVDRGERLETLLGSCVAILLTDPRRTVGAMCHIVHAGPPRGAPPACATAFGDAALAEMGRLLRLRGIDPRQCEAWVYGGGHMFPGQVGSTVAEGNVGTANFEWALAALHAVGIRVLDVSLGGHAYRKLRWTIGPEQPEVELVPMPAPPAASLPAALERSPA